MVKTMHISFAKLIFYSQSNHFHMLQLMMPCGMLKQCKAKQRRIKCWMQLYIIDFWVFNRKSVMRCGILHEIKRKFLVTGHTIFKHTRTLNRNNYVKEALQNAIVANFWTWIVKIRSQITIIYIIMYFHFNVNGLNVRSDFNCTAIYWIVWLRIVAQVSRWLKFKFNSQPNGIKGKKLIWWIQIRWFQFDWLHEHFA